MNDLISRKALCNDLREYKVHPVPISSDESEVKGYNNGIDLAISVIAEFPSTEPERKTGKWVYKTTDAYIQRTCSSCGWSERMYYRNRNQDGLIRNYCPNCGCKNGV